MNTLFVSLAGAWGEISPLLVRLILLLIFLLIGYLAAKFLDWLVASSLKLVQLDRGAKSMGFANLLERGEIKKTPAELLGSLVYWLVIFVTIVGIAKYFGLPIEPALTQVFSFLGLVFMSAIVLGIGVFFASFFANLIKFVAINLGLEGAKVLARVVYYIVVVFAFLAALAQLGVRVEVIGEKLDVIVGAIGLAAAIAFGLGCKDMAADFLHNLFRGK
ncbi:MAG: mechanosensitive ion channel family protein [Candidatus Margulisiibacteriota bacterium]